MAWTVSTSTCSLLRAHRVLVAISSCFRSVFGGPKTLVVLEQSLLLGLLPHELVHLDPHRTDVETATEPQGPRQCTSPFGEF